MSKFEEDLKTLMGAMMDGFTKDIIVKNEDVALKIKAIYDEDEKRFFDKVQSVKLHFNTIVGQVVSVPKQKNIYILEYITSGLYEHFFRQLMEKTEGSSCCADKSRYVNRMTLYALKENKNLSLYADYTNCDQIKEDKELQAYWSPKTIKDTDTAMKMFWDWYLLRN